MEPVWGFDLLLRGLIPGLLALYLFSYFDGSPSSGRRYSKRVTHWTGWRWFWTKVLQLPLGEVHAEAFEEEVTRKKAKDGVEPRQFIFGGHPHGVSSLHHMGLMLCPPVCAPGLEFERISPGSGRRDLAASILFLIPGWRDLVLASGGVDAGRSTAKRMLKEGMSLGIMIGGEQEQLLSQAGQHLAYIEHRKGFIKLALVNGVPIVPCWCFGETDLFEQSRSFFKLRQWVVKHLGVAITLGRGRVRLVTAIDSTS